MSHFDYAVRYDLRVARRFVEPLEHGEPVPGCGCPDCTGVPEDSPARQPVRPRDFSGWEERAEQARSIGLLEICRRLGLEIQRKGSALYTSCPLHEDKTPSLSLDPKLGRSGLWHCFSCEGGGDAIELFMRARRMGFADAVRELVPVASHQVRLED
jgi:hypothetical protein